eukprot:6115103-Amphidinium_carterae.1
MESAPWGLSAGTPVEVSGHIVSLRGHMLEFAGEPSPLNAADTILEHAKRNGGWGNDTVPLLQ